MGNRLRQAEQRLFDHYGLDLATRDVWLEDPPVRVRVLESGEGPALVLMHGSGMAASTWAPLLPHLVDRRLVAVDLPGFGLSDPYDYGGRSLRRHAVAQVRSLLDALALPRADIAGTSLGAMWALSFAQACPGRVHRVVSIGVPAVALPGMHGDRFFSLVSKPVVGALAVRLRPPSAGIARRALADVLGPTALARTPDEWFDVVRQAMRVRGWPLAMRSHMRLALRNGRPRPENCLSDDELRALQTPVLFIWGDRDVYGSPAIGRRAVELMPDARLEVVPGNHAPFLDDPERCAALIARFLAVVPNPSPGVG